MSELIDREATVKQICKMGEMVGGHDRDVVISIALFVQDDKTAFPTVERPHGTWGVYGATCSKCGKESDYRTPFCAWCGDDKRGETE